MAGKTKGTPENKKTRLALIPGVGMDNKGREGAEGCRRFSRGVGGARDKERVRARKVPKKKTKMEGGGGVIKKAPPIKFRSQRDMGPEA